MKHQHSNDEPKCVVCGAACRHTGWRRFSNGKTCDPTCKRAHATGRTRPQQIKAEMFAADRAARAEEIASRMTAQMYRRFSEDSDYNRPYLAA
jgi:hypothetical protein